MLPLVAIATSLIPDLIGIFAGDKAGTVAHRVAQAVREATGTDDPVRAKQKLDSDPALTSQLQVRLVQIALDAQKAQNDADERKAQDQLQLLKTQFEADAERRQVELDELKSRLQTDAESSSSARQLVVELAKQGSPVIWVSAVLSAVVALGFFIVLGLLVYGLSNEAASNQLLNITVGALVAGFSTVLNFWLGSSQASRDKDRAITSVQAVQASETARRLSEQSKELTAIRTIATQAAGAGGSRAAPKTVEKPDDFDACLHIVLASEGGYSDRPDDGPTNFGITLNTLEDWRRSHAPKGQAPPVTADDVKDLTLNEACEIYRTNYWKVLSCADLPRGVDLVVFDFGVNAGPGRAALCLQQIVGTKQDGSIGPVTIAAVDAYDPRKLIQRYSARRLEIYRAYSNFAEYGAGWTARIDRTEQAALRMAT